MAKRRNLKDDEEDEQDKDYEEKEESDDDFLPSSDEDESESLSKPLTRLRVGENNPAASREVATDDSQDSDEDSDENVRTGRTRICGPTKYCGVVSDRKEEPRKAKRTGGAFICPNCGSNFTRREGVNYHFAGCVEKYGNPEGHKWDDHPSCSSSKQRVTMRVQPKAPTQQPPAKPVKKLEALSSKKAITRPSTKAKTANTRAASTHSALHPPTASPLPAASHPPTASPPPNASSKPIRTRVGASSKTKVRSKEVTLTMKQPDPRKFALDQSHPPLFKLEAIFHDMLLNAWDKINMKEAMDSLSTKQIHIATMCSGTESPLLALGIIQKDLELNGKPALNIKHMFSAEIVPYKQAYIERNFHPHLLFRDIREMAEGGQATTAYGALTDVPPDVDMLVAGFSCVDFSKLNSHGKELTDIGESGDTFRAIMDYSKRYRPAVVILENVDGAPWDLIQFIWENNREAIRKYQRKGSGEHVATARDFEKFWDEDDHAYSAVWHRVDAKNYYIPQTRTRRYMICLDRHRFPSPKQADEAVQNWKRYMVALERKASAPVEAFLLPEDDPRLQYAKDEMSKTGKLRRETDWEVCQGRHEDYRTKEKLGTLRPILQWTNDGFAKASSYLWTDWTLTQVERIWDTIEISYLRNAAKGFDSFSKSRFWELSQNIDRFLDTTPDGVIGCLTPKGQQFSTIRGRPITGLEAIALQGLPIDTLLLTRESQKELIDLGGNAMTSTAVGAALVAGLTVSHTVLTRAKGSTSQLLQNPGKVSEGMTFGELGEQQTLTFHCSGELSPEEIIKMGKETVRLCHCEGQKLIASAPIRRCKRCNHHCCEKCGNFPKHDYKVLKGNDAPLRTEPHQFGKRLEQALPTRLVIDGFSDENLDILSQLVPDKAEEDWAIIRTVLLLVRNKELRYESKKRTHCLTISYQATGARLDFVSDGEDLYWLLYGQADDSEPGNSRIRKLLQSPLARLTVRGQRMRGGICTAKSVLEGSWEVRVPLKHIFPILVEPQGDLTDSWEKRLGLVGAKFIDKQVCTSLRISLVPDSAVAEPILDHEISGIYDLLPDCGTACSSLHKKRPSPDSSNEQPIFLFLEADRNGPPNDDSFVFSTDIHRLEYGENRYVAATVDNKWRPPFKSADLDFTSSPVQVSCTLSSRWEACALTLRPHQGSEEASSRFPKNDMSIPVFGTSHALSNPSTHDLYGCLHEEARTALLSCVIPELSADSHSWRIGQWTVMNQKSTRVSAAELAWLFVRVKDLKGFSPDWRPLVPPSGGFQNCTVCAPKLPPTKWTCSRGGKQDKIIPYEDGREAGEYERNIKARPDPFLVQTRIDNDEKHAGRLQVGLHLPTLVHRGLAQLSDIAEGDDIEVDWRLDTQYEPPTHYTLPDFTLTNNKLNLEAPYAFPTGENLRPEQKRSLHWMIGQESDDMAFHEEAIEEAVLSQLGWRAEVRIRRKRFVRGGILADEVGYGKTATTLALVDAQAGHAERFAKLQNVGCIRVQATLILVPAHLVYQWRGQAAKFLGFHSDDERILVIDKVSNLAKISVRRMKKAVIVLTSWAVLSSPTYMMRMSHFAALPMGPSSGGREIKAWLNRSCENIEKHTGELVSERDSPKTFAEVLKRRLKDAHKDETILRDIPTQRLKGAKYNTWNPADIVTPVDSCPKDEDLETIFKHMTNSEDLNSMTGILFHMFHFHRVVVDEYTYIDDNQHSDQLSSSILSVKAHSRWVLSGTPGLQDQLEAHNLARHVDCDLGVVDDAAGALKGASIKDIRDPRTATEQFLAFGYSRTAAYHRSRQLYAQKFLDSYASKNIPEIGLIKSVSCLRPHLLGATETIPNAELQQQLQSTQMNIVLQGKSKKENDRFRRYQELLQGCKSGPECLIKSCLWFEMEDATSAQIETSEDAMDIDDNDLTKSSPGTCQSLIAIREEQWDTVIEDLKHNLLHAAWLEEQCLRAPRQDPQGTHFFRWMSEIGRAGLQDPAATSVMRHHLVQALSNVNADTEEIYYRDPPTAEDLKAEKEAADVRKKQDKAKRIANKKNKEAIGSYKRRKTSRTSKVTVLPDEDSVDMVASDSEGIPADDTRPAGPKPNKVQEDDFETFSSELRGLTAHLRGLAVELTSRARSLRFARGAQELQQWHFGPGKEPTCESCGRSVHDEKDMSINIGCGHLTCKLCTEGTNSAVCAVDGCEAGSELYRLRKAADLIGDGKTWEYGARLGSIVKLIKSLPEDEQVLLFVQFEDVMVDMARGLEERGISNHALSQSAGRRLIEWMNDFQDNDGADKKKVLLLNPLSEIASGINLTNANHIIFACPLLTTTQASYNASMTQCIGRAKRYGQQKTVHIYQFLALKTVDVDILQEREQKTLAKKVGKARKSHVYGGPGKKQDPIEWRLVNQNEIDSSMEAGWGSGYDFKSNPTGDDY